MKRASLMRLLAVAAVLTCGTTSARASLISWSYDWLATPGAVTTPPAVPGDPAKITLSNEPFKTAFNDSDVVATNLKTFSTANPFSNQFDVFGAADGKYTLTLTLKDLASSASAVLNFTGQMQGLFSALNANVTNAFDLPITQSVTLGNNVYTVTMTSYTPPGPPAQGNLGSIGAHVSVAARLPEPSSIALAMFGLGLTGLRALRRRQQQRRRPPEAQLGLVSG